jgi:regulator of protease activity HflC (stomatin/prohibitin superfamily)
MVTARLTQYHIVVETVSITDFKFTKEYDASIEAKVKAMQDAERAQNELVKVKIEAEKAEAEAKGKALANVADAEGEAKAIIAKANAQAEANRKLAASITPELILNKAIEKWDGTRPMVEGGNSGLLIQLPPTRARKGSAAAADKDSDN